jgi:hypothetical protein
MSAVAATAFLDWTKSGMARAATLGRALGEYLRLVIRAKRTWLVGTVLAGGAAWFHVLFGVAVPGWAIAGIVVATLVAVQFQAYRSVREDREALRRARIVDAIVDDIAQLRTREGELRNRAVRDGAAYERWRAELVALRAEIHAKIGRISRAEAETYHTIGNLRHTAAGGIDEEHNLLLAVAARDLDHLADLIHGYARFRD